MRNQSLRQHPNKKSAPTGQLRKRSENSCLGKGSAPRGRCGTGLPGQQTVSIAGCPRASTGRQGIQLYGGQRSVLQANDDVLPKALGLPYRSGSQWATGSRVDLTRPCEANGKTVRDVRVGSAGQFRGWQTAISSPIMAASRRFPSRAHRSQTAVPPRRSPLASCRFRVAGPC